MKIEVYIKSIAYNRDVSKQIYQTKFVACVQYRTNLPDIGLEGRLFDPENTRIMQALDNLPALLRRNLVVVDVDRFPGRLKAWRAGVRQAPTVILDGRIFSGAEAGKALAELKSFAG